MVLTKPSSVENLRNYSKFSVTVNYRCHVGYRGGWMSVCVCGYRKKQSTVICQDLFLAFPLKAFKALANCLMLSGAQI